MTGIPLKRRDLDLEEDTRGGGEQTPALAEAGRVLS